MIGECLERRASRDHLALDEGLKDVGCSARITRVLERSRTQPKHPRGGTQPFRPPAGSRDCRTRPATSSRSRTRTKATRRPSTCRCATPTRRGVTESGPSRTLSPSSTPTDGATLEVAPSAKQSLLELRSERERLEQLEGLFAEALQRIKMAERAAERASGNGHLKG